jgi:hypothetical protein
MTVSRSQPKSIRGAYEWFCAVVLAGVSGWLLLAVGAVVLTVLSWFFTVVKPIVCFLEPWCGS